MSRPADRALLRVPLSRIRLDPDRPRRDCPEEGIARLAESIRLHGQLTPLLLRPEADGCYLLIAGERRLRALKMLNRPWAEALALPAGDCECALIALVENLQREQLHYLDAAQACRDILERYPITQERLATSLSCSPSALANRLRLLKLGPRTRDALRSGGLSERHARALLALEDEADRLALATLAAERRMSVRELEQAVRQRLAQPAKKPKRPTPALRDNRIVINALMDTVRRLTRIGVPVTSRVEEGEGCVNVIVTIRAGGAAREA